MVTWDSYRTVVVIKLRRTSALEACCPFGPRHKGATAPVGFKLRFELATNGIQFYAFANLDKTSLL